MFEPFNEERMNGSMNRIFRRPILIVQKGREISNTGFRAPKCNMYETDKSVVAAFELPGVEKEDIELNILDDRIEVKVEKKQEKEDRQKGMYRYEASSQSFYRIIPLPVNVKSENAQAEYTNGVLKIEIPKAKPVEHKKKRVEIK